MKTVLVLDHGPNLAHSCGEFIDNFTTKDGKSSRNSHARLSKSLWTSSVEAALEYLRFIIDIYTENDRPPLRFVLSDSVGRFLTPSWASKFLTLDHILKALATNGPPDQDADPDSCCIINGVSLAVEALSEATEKQVKSSLNADNRGRIVVITHLKQNEEVSMIEQHVLEQIESRNKLVQNLDESYLPLKEVQLCIINTYPCDTLTNVENKKLISISDNLLSEVKSTQAGSQMISCIHGILLDHCDLVSTTISGIPMKEEANQGQSTNYDVELFHHKNTHSELDRLGLLSESAGLTTYVANGVYRTLCLVWCTPNSKNPIQQFPNVASAHRLTVASVNSRPSACLTTFLLSGKNVMLEIPRKSNTANTITIPSNIGCKLISHLLMAHDGLLYMHSMALGRGLCDEPPSISEGPGGRVGDYRISNFGDLMRECRLTPLNDSVSIDPHCPNKAARVNLRRLTRYWPMTYSESLVFSILPKFEPLVSLVKKAELTTKDVDQCTAHIYTLISMEQSKDPLVTPFVQCAKIKGIKNKEEQYRLAFIELADYLRNYADNSDNHRKVLDCFLTCSGQSNELVTLLDVELDVCNKSDPIREVRKIEPASSPPPKKRKIVNPLWGPNERVNLYDYFLDKYNIENWSRWRDFEGRKACTGTVAVLYKELDKKIRGRNVENEAS